MNYGAIIKGAWQATWRYRAMWLLGMAVLGGCNGGNFFNAAANAIPDSSTSTDYETQLLLDQLGETMQEYWILVVLLISCLVLLMIVAYVCHFIAIGGLYQGAAAARLQQPVRFTTMCRAGTVGFWRTVGLAILLRLMLIIPLICIGIVIVLLAITIVGLVFAIPLFLALIVIMLPLGWITTTVFSFALQGIILERLGIWPSLKLAWARWRLHWKDTVLIYLLIVVSQIIVGVILLAALGVISVPLVIFGYFAYSSQAWLAIGLLILVGLLLMLTVAFIVRGMSQSFISHLWHRLYAEIVERQLTSSNQLPG